jgi:hypothetical protein
MAVFVVGFHRPGIDIRAGSLHHLHTDKLALFRVLLDCRYCLKVALRRISA